MKLLSPVEEAAACRAAWAAAPDATHALHCHHETLAEPLTRPAEERIAYILSDKPKPEQALRLRLFRPLPPEYARVTKAARVEYARVTKPAHDAACIPDCPWNGWTIFPKAAS